jgi:hypothetical protein
VAWYVATAALDFHTPRARSCPMHFWIIDPRMFGSLVRPGVSFGPEELQSPNDPHRHKPSRFPGDCLDLPLGSVSSEYEANANGERLIWLPAAIFDRLKALRGPGESLQRRHSAAGGLRRAAPWSKPPVTARSARPQQPDMGPLSETGAREPRLARQIRLLKDLVAVPPQSLKISATHRLRRRQLPF